MKKNPRIGSSFDDLLEEEGMLNEINIVAIKRVIAWQIQQEMVKQNMSKTEMAKQMQISRSSLDRLLDPDNPALTLDAIECSAIIEKRVRFELMD